MKRLHLRLLAGAIIMLTIGTAGCGVMAPKATPTAVPSDTPTLTLTPLPTYTPTVLPTSTPTATPNAAATQSARVTEQTEKESADLTDNLAELGVAVDTGSLGFYQLTPQKIEILEHNSWNYVPFAEDITPSDFVLSTDITWDTPGLATCGIIFRSEKNFEKGAQYIFQMLRLSGLPAWDIEYIKDGFYENSPAQIKTSGAIDQANGATNHIVLVAEGEKFTLYINGVRQGSYYDYSKQRLEGKLGFYAWQDAGDSTCTFENTAIWVYK